MNTSLPLSPLKLSVLILLKLVKEFIPVEVLKLNVSAPSLPLNTNVSIPLNNVVIDELLESLKLKVSSPSPPATVTFVILFEPEVLAVNVKPVAVNVAPELS